MFKKKLTKEEQKIVDKFREEQEKKKIEEQKAQEQEKEEIKESVVDKEIDVDFYSEFLNLIDKYLEIRTIDGILADGYLVLIELNNDKIKQEILDSFKDEQ